MVIVKRGDRLVHPIHGMGVVEMTRPATDSKGDRIKGYEVVLRFNKYIEGVKWMWDDKGVEKSQLIFNSSYLDKFTKL